MSFPSQFSLTALDGANGFTINGEVALDASGFSVSSAGDFNGDGFDDLLIGAYRAGPNRAFFPGKSYVLFGSRAGFPETVELTSINGTNGFIPVGALFYEFSGYAVGVSDINGDGFSDILLGAPEAQEQFANPYNDEQVIDTGRGHGHVVFGTDQVQSQTLDLSGLDGDDGFEIFPEPIIELERLEDEYGVVTDIVYLIDNGALGYSISGAGDVNGDGFQDFIIGSPTFDYDEDNRDNGRAYVVYGSDTFNPRLGLTTLDGGNGFIAIGESANDLAGASVGGGGDFNGDGFADVIVGSPEGGTDRSRLNSGVAHIIFGSGDDFSSSFRLYDVGQTVGGVRLNGDLQNDGAGRSVANAGDVNGDGLDDFIIGAPEADSNGNSSGTAYVVFGSRTAYELTPGTPVELELSELDGSTGFRIVGGTGGVGAGSSVSGAGDVNGDGFADVIIGAPSDGPTGAAYVVFGTNLGFSPQIDLGSMPATQGVRFEGLNTGDAAGTSVAAAGDINRDGIGDLLIGAPGSDVNRTGSGQSYVVFGQLYTPLRAPDLATASDSGSSATDDITNVRTPTITGVGLGRNGEFRVISSIDGLIGTGTATADGEATITVDRLSQGDHTLTFRAVLDGTVSPSGPSLDVTIDSTPLARPDPATLFTGSDSGLSNADRVTNDNTPDLLGEGAVADALIEVESSIDGVLGTAQVSGSGSWSLTAPTLSDGVHRISITQLDVAGNRSSQPADLTVTIDTVAPGRPGTPDLLASSDFGSSRTDNVTSDLSPTFAGDGAAAGTFVRLTSSLGGSLGEVEVANDGSWEFTAPRLILGTHQIQAQFVDLAGNESPTSSALTIQVVEPGEDGVTPGGGGGGPSGEAPRIISGEIGADVIEGNVGDDELRGEGGNDVLIGGLGADALDGGDGIDWVFYSDSAAGVVVRLWDGGSESGGDAEGDTLLSIENVRGSNLDDILSGNDGANVLEGLRGDDTIAGREGDDLLRGAHGDDVVDGGAGDDDAVGGPGNDTVLGGDGNDALRGNSQNDLLDGQGGSDRVYGNIGGDRVRGGDGDDFLWGLTGNDRLYGGAGNDELFGGFGGDILQGGGGDDTLVGQGGADIFQMTDNGGVDSIRDFEASGQFRDVIDIHRLVDDIGFAGPNVVSAGFVQVTQDGDDALVAYQRGTQVITIARVLDIDADILRDDQFFLTTDDFWFGT